jgi:hypothetical protein
MIYIADRLNVCESRVLDRTVLCRRSTFTFWNVKHGTVSDLAITITKHPPLLGHG